MYSIGIDIGGMSVKIGTVVNNVVTSFKSLPTSSNIDYDEFIADVSNIIKELMSEISDDKLSMIGISSCGLIDSSKGKILYSNNIKWEDKNILADIQKIFNVPAKIANDAKCALLAEAVLGESKEFDRVCMITIGTGVGGGFIQGKKLDATNFYAEASGILGHITIVSKGRKCTCGHEGCLEAYASATALINSYAEKTGNKVSAKDICDKVRLGEEEAIEVFNEFLDYLGDGLVSLGNALRPEVIVIGGGVSQSSDLFLDYLNDYVNKRIFGGAMLPIKIIPATLANDAGIVGATLL